MIPVLKRKVWDWILPEYFGYLVDWTMSTFHMCIIALLLTSKTKCCDQLKEDLLNYVSSLECFLIFSCWRQENKHFVVDTLFFRKCKMTSRETETHCVGPYSSNEGSFKNPILVPNELTCFCNWFMCVFIAGSFFWEYCLLSLGFSLISAKVSSEIGLLSGHTLLDFRMALLTAVLIAVMIKSAYLSKSLVDRSPEKSAEPSASLSVDSNTSRTVWSNLYLVWLVNVFLCGGVSIEISMGRWSLPKSSPIWNYMSCFAKFGDINAISSMSVLPLALSICVCSSLFK